MKESILSLEEHFFSPCIQYSVFEKGILIADKRWKSFYLKYSKHLIYKQTLLS